MNDDQLHAHITAIAARGPAEARHLTSRLVRTCWPGGAEDVIEPGAIGYLRRWRPTRAAASLPSCGCAGGQCTVCN